MVIFDIFLRQKEFLTMRKLTSFLFMSLDGIVEAPNKFVRDDLSRDLLSLIGETIAEQDAVLLGRKMYEEWSTYWPESKIEPFSTFINKTPKYVVSHTLKTLDWRQSNLLPGDLHDEIVALKSQTGKTIGVHGSISLVQSLLVAGLLDELRFVLFPAVVGQGRRLLSRDGAPIQLNLQSARATPNGLLYLIFHPRG
jgi:dihydrofolate reductase